MGIALFNIADFLTPLQSLADRWMPRRRPGRRAMSSGLRYVGIRPSCAQRHATGSATAAASAAAALPPLRVVRMVDAQHPGRAAGRMVISGRMADVCAELDRLVALEAATALPRAHLH